MISLKNLLAEGPFSNRIKPSGYQNVTWGDGIVGDSRPSRDLNLNPSLLNDIETAAVEAGVDVTITTAISGHRTGTRHNPAGNAIDIAVVNGYGYSSQQDAKRKGIYDAIMDFVRALQDLGYKKNRESGNDKAVLTFGFPNHHHHIHVSRRSREDDVTQKETPDFDEVDTITVTGLSYGARSPKVKDMQQRLIYILNDPLAVGPPQDDGIFGPYTEKGLITFQKDQGLDSTGIYDEETKTKLENLTADVSSTELSNIKTAFDASLFGSIGDDDDFYKAILKGIGAPITDENMKFLYAWRQAEGARATNNPFNTTKTMNDPGSSIYNYAKVKNYSTPEIGIEATIKTLLLPYYTDIVNDLRDDAGAEQIASNHAQLKTWGTGTLISQVLKSGNINPPPIASA
jgi:peptidoglycan hydrolase-like protein with peptidoglycan-binding domain